MDTIRRLFRGRLRYLYGVFKPEPLVRGEQEQRQVDLQTQRMALYQFPTCPFCIRVRRGIRRLNLNIETRNVARHPQWRAELKDGGGKIQAPCLKIVGEDGQVQWMYESADILDYLHRRFAGSPDK